VERLVDFRHARRFRENHHGGGTGKSGIVPFVGLKASFNTLCAIVCAKEILYHLQFEGVKSFQPPDAFSPANQGVPPTTEMSQYPAAAKPYRLSAARHDHAESNSIATRAEIEEKLRP
jgi:hypothetical protein